jgi:hypothetical protein
MDAGREPGSSLIRGSPAYMTGVYDHAESQTPPFQGENAQPPRP